MPMVRKRERNNLSIFVTVYFLIKGRLFYRSAIGNIEKFGGAGVDKLTNIRAMPRVTITLDDSDAYSYGPSTMPIPYKSTPL